eukprot:TRINITY_DN8310_c0_g1_i1.p3 TRINITY_DN8310_c0_g1~~TRINITY_DN8310_c0_g1_i1.p3  ORF type:complete len:164 (+),score=16.15 TRINITY_DN8310_c0_g1_i1:247-738(+)
MGTGVGGVPLWVVAAKADAWGGCMHGSVAAVAAAVGVPAAAAAAAGGVRGGRGRARWFVVVVTSAASGLVRMGVPAGFTWLVGEVVLRAGAKGGGDTTVPPWPLSVGLFTLTRAGAVARPAVGWPARGPRPAAAARADSACRQPRSGRHRHRRAGVWGGRPRH